MREEELRKADERAWAEQNAHKTANTKTKQPNQLETPTNSSNSPKSAQTTKSEPKPKPTIVKFTEKLARYPATIVTSSGYGELSLRGEPSVKGVQVTTVYDGAEVQVIAETNRCETISGVRGCWHKVSIDGVKGYMFSGYLQRELMSQAQK